MNDDKHAYTVLFVEDEVKVRKNYVMYLEMIFDSVYEASDGEEAYTIYKEKKIDILIVDINIPKLNGLELLAKIREDDYIVKAIVLTAHKDTDFLLQATRLQLTDYLVKPISRLALKKALDKVISELENFTTTAIKTKSLKDGCIWNYDKEELVCNGKTVQLTNKEKILFSLFMSNLNAVLSVDSILYSVWNDNLEVNTDVFKTVLKNLRRKLPEGIIKNIHGIGYKIVT